MKYILLLALFISACGRQSDSPQSVPTKVVTFGLLPVDKLQQESIPFPPGQTFDGPKLVDIPENQWVWIRPYTLWVTDKGQVFINGNHTYSVSPQTDYIRALRIGRTWKVSLSGTKCVWSAIEISIDPSRYGELPCMPVVEIVP